MSTKKNTSQKNKNSRIVSKIGEHHVHTETPNRETMRLFVTTNKRRNSTKLKIYDDYGLVLELDGHNTRLLSRVLDRHYDNVDIAR